MLTRSVLCGLISVISAGKHQSLTVPKYTWGGSIFKLTAGHGFGISAMTLFSVGPGDAANGPMTSPCALRYATTCDLPSIHSSGSLVFINAFPPWHDIVTNITDITYSLTTYNSDYFI